MLLHLLLAAAVAPVQDVRETWRLLRVDPAAIAARESAFFALGFDHVSRNRETGALEFAADGADLAALDRARIPYRVVIDDLERYYAARLDSTLKSAGSFGGWLSPPFAQGGMGGYYTFNQVVSVLDQIHAAYPAITAAKASLGNSVQARPLWMLKVSDNPGIDENEPEVRLDSLHHAREPEGMQASLWFMLFLVESYGTDPLATYLVDTREFYFVPVVNPDGYVYNQSTNPGGGGMWRKNRRTLPGGAVGVDLNRNYPDHWGWDDVGSSSFPSDETYRGPSAASEPEIQVMTGFISARQFQSALSIHTYSNLWLYPFGYAQVYPANNAQYVEISTLATEVNQYVVGPPSFVLYLANGVTCDYDHDTKGTLAWSPEIGSDTDGFWPATNRIIPLADENLLAFQRTALAAGAWARVLSSARVEVGDGDGFFEAGEKARFTATARNSGRATSATPVALALTSASPWAVVTAGFYSYGALPAFSQANNNAAPLELSIAANAPPGATIDYQLELVYEGWTQTIPGQIAVGEPVPFVIDDAEVDWGWTKGIAGDTATSGLWTRGAPIATNSSGAPANPGADHTPPPGTQCFVTGNAGGSAGTDDVDSGATTLISPVFDLSAVGPATVSYARWWADLTVQDDLFQISISNNGGQSWVPLESLAVNANQWNVASFLVPSVLPQTANMRLRFVASDAPNNSIVEAAVDDLQIQIFDVAPRLNLYGPSTAGSTTLANVTGQAGDHYVVYVTLADPAAHPQGPLSTQGVATGTIPASRLARVQLIVPTDPALHGRTLWYRALVGTPGNAQATNWDSLVVQ